MRRFAYQFALTYAVPSLDLYATVPVEAASVRSPEEGGFSDLLEEVLLVLRDHFQAGVEVREVSPVLVIGLEDQALPRL